MLFTFPNILGGVDSSFVPLQCFLWYSQCLLFQKSFRLDTRRKRKNVLFLLLAMTTLWRRNQPIMSTWTKKFLLWDLERISEVKYVFGSTGHIFVQISVTQTVVPGQCCPQLLLVWDEISAEIESKHWKTSKEIWQSHFMPVEYNRDNKKLGLYFVYIFNNFF